MFSLESTLEKTIESTKDLPECLRCHDLSDRAVGGTAYRGGERRKKPDFHGYDFADTIEKALAGLTALGGGSAVALYDIRAYAWPLIWLRYADAPDIAIFAGRDGELHAFSGP
jgi:hypothetical protein